MKCANAFNISLTSIIIAAGTAKSNSNGKAVFHVSKEKKASRTSSAALNIVITSDFVYVYMCLYWLTALLYHIRSPIKRTSAYTEM